MFFLCFVFSAVSISVSVPASNALGMGPFFVILSGLAAAAIVWRYAHEQPSHPQRNPLTFPFPLLHNLSLPSRRMDSQVVCAYRLSTAAVRDV
jgi:hypothetical protein